MRTFLAILAGLSVIGATIPYIFDVVRGRVRPMRSTRLMFVFLLMLAFFQQRSLGTGLSLFVTIGELLSTLSLFVISMKKGVGGLRKLDIWCYGLLIVSVVVWQVSGNALLALIFTILTDFIAFFPVAWRLIHDPLAETQIFYWGAIIGPILGILAEKSPSWQRLSFVIYLAGINLLAVILINRKHFILKTEAV